MHVCVDLEFSIKLKKLKKKKQTTNKPPQTIPAENVELTPFHVD